jgi:hypothetical protein
MTTFLLAELGGFARCGAAFASVASAPEKSSSKQEANVAVAMLIDNPEGSQEVYEQIRAHIGLDKPAGGIFHVAGPSPAGGWRVIEVWDSEEEAEQFFKERFVPALQALGIPGPPPPRQFWPVHNAMK